MTPGRAKPPLLASDCARHRFVTFGKHVGAINRRLTASVGIGCVEENRAGCQLQRKSDGENKSTTSKGMCLETSLLGDHIV
jgi:hypothetical protein